MVRSGLTLAAALLLLLAAMALKGTLIPLPSSPSEPTADRFDAHRAAARLARILGDQRPHPVDSPASDAVRRRLLAEMRAVGLDPQVSDDFACNGHARGRAVGCARVRNLVATIGPRRGRHLLLSAHYDGTFAGPGAADAGIAVATLLETAHLLRGRTLGRPVTFLFNEGEEMGLIGARAFLDRDPLAEQVDSALNFEARGVTGPATMFETSRPNGPAIARFARSVDRPVANSLSTDLYRLIPNSTDVAVFEERDWTILNFAIIGNETRYHSAGDDLAALDRRSLQHMGDQALALTLDLAQRPAPTASGEWLYADLAGRQLLTLPLLPALALLGLLLVFFMALVVRRRAIARPCAAVAIGLLGAGGIAWAGQAILSVIRSGDYWRGHPWVTELAVYGSAMAAILLALLLVAPGSGPRPLRAAFWLIFLAGGAATSAVAPGAAIYFLFPPLVAAAGILLGRRWPVAEPAGAIAAALLLFLSFGPALSLFEELMSNGPHWMFAPIGAVILLPALIELLPLIRRVPRILVLAGAGDLFLLPWAAVALTPAYSEDRQQLFAIEYVWDADARTGRWAVNNDGAPVPFAADWERAELPHSMRKRWVAPAPALPVAAPAVEIAARRPVAGGRRLTLRLRTGGAESVTLLAPPDAAVRAAGEPGYLRRYRPGGREDRYALRCVGRSCDGALIELVIGRPEPVEFTVIGTRSGLPPAAAPLVAARPERARPQYAPDTTISISRTRM
ncbi:M28 family peptidase [Sphingosinicella sp. CPCC 101087]|uniref:M28 family peptidase n=1 Tax=Sphingosinicella sp. CPCC 101087 TaxID=2497754 RepID=UPI00101C2105|nr:M28 family peptidase [Sphingosinicella sp. CPCC 101087]